MGLTRLLDSTKGLESFFFFFFLPKHLFSAGSHYAWCFVMYTSAFVERLIIARTNVKELGMAYSVLLYSCYLSTEKKMLFYNKFWNLRCCN